MAVTRDSNNESNNTDQPINMSMRNQKITGRGINRDINLLDKKLDSLYKDIYISRPDNKQNLNDIIDNIDLTIDQLQGTDINASGMTELVKRIDSNNSKNSDKLISGVQELFDNENILGTMFKNENINKYIASENYNYDLICKYLPKLQDALEIKRDNVLCSDNFSKEFVIPNSGKSSKEEINKFNTNIKKLEREYDITEFFDKTYMNTSKYGEDFIYIVPYNVAFERLFKRSAKRLNSARAGQVSLFEGYTVENCLKNGYESSEDFSSYIKSIDMPKDELNDITKNMPELGEINIHFNRSGIIESAVNEYAVLRDVSDSELVKSMSAIYEDAQNVLQEKRTGISSIFDGVKKQNKKLAQSGLANDGLVVPADLDRDASKLDKNFLGTVLERLPRENIVPVYIGKKCLGYYYLEFAEDKTACGFCGGHHMTPGVGNASRFAYETTEQQQELAIRYIASRISKSIDTKFINVNKDLKEEIYAILNYNDKFDITRTNDIGVSFIPANDIVHTYFELDEHTHRGISDLRRALIPAMLYILLYLTDIIGKITRSTDRRIYYVKQNVEQNVARTMMNVVQQIKKGNMGMRQIESMNNILNIVGKYNDFIIPMGQSGDPPIQFEVMPGQDTQTPTDLMEKMEEAAVNTIMPMEFVNATYQQDFATRFTMSNTRFMKSVLTRQRKCEKFFSAMYTKIYNYEFGETNYEIEITLPPPSYLIINNNSQLFDNVNQMADKIVESELVNEEDDVKMEFKKLYIRENLSSYIDFDNVNKLKELAKVNVAVEKNPSTEDGDNSDMNGMMDDDI